LIRLFAKKWRAAERVYRAGGFFALLWELFCQGLKPLVVVYDYAIWRWYSIRGRFCFTVLGHRISVLPKDKGIARELAAHRIHEPLATQLIESYLKPGMNVIDIGSNIGYYALLEARLVGAHGRVIAIEPVPDNFRQLSKNIRDNGYKNILKYQVAIGDQTGTAPMHISEKSNWHCLSPVPWKTTEILVPVTTLDALLATCRLHSVDLVRMDLEGYEVVVIRGMQQTLAKYSPKLLVELHPQVIGTQAIVGYLRLLKSLGYTLEWLIDQERDRPLRWLFLEAERVTLDELTTDLRIRDDKRAVTVLLSRNSPNLGVRSLDRQEMDATLLSAGGSPDMG